MDELGRELTRSEKAKIRRAVESACANYDREYGCLPLETECYMNTVGYVGSSLCRHFREAILPASPELLAIFQHGGTRNCKWCGQPFPETGHRQYCSWRCADAAKRAASRERVRRFRDRGNARACNVFARENARAAGLFKGQIRAGRWSYRPGRKRQE